MEKEVISSRQFTIITFLLSIGTAILIIPSSIASSSKQDAWIAASIGIVLSLLVVKLFVTLGDQTPTLNFIEANEKLLGRFLEKSQWCASFLLPYLREENYCILLVLL